MTENDRTTDDRLLKLVQMVRAVSVDATGTAPSDIC